MEKNGKLSIERMLTNSKRNLWTSCHRRFYYSQVEQLEPIVTPRALRIGTLVHIGLAAHYERMQRGRLTDPYTAMNIKADEYEKDLERYSEREPTTDIQGMLEELEENMGTAKQLVGRYIEAYDHNEWQVLGVEVPLTMRLLTPKGTSSHWQYNGTLDLIIRDQSDGRIKVVDHKTTTIGHREAFAEQLMLDPQSPGYLMLLNFAQDSIVKELQGEGPHLDFIFNVIRNKIPTSPKTLVCKKCNPKIKKEPGYINPDCPVCSGTNVSGLSKDRRIETTPEMWDSTLDQYKHLSPVDYEEQIAKARATADNWLYRIELEYTPNKLNDFAAECYEITRSISEANYWDRNFTACFRPGRRCAFRFLCLEEDREAQAEARKAFRVRGEEIDDEAVNDLMQESDLPF